MDPSRRRWARAGGIWLALAMPGLLLGLQAGPAAARNLYVGNQGTGDVSVIDTATNQTVGSPITTGSQPAGIAVSPDGQRAYVANLNDNDVSVIDTATNSVVGAPIPVNRPGGIAITPDGKRAYVAGVGSNQVSVIDLARNQVIGTVAVGSNPQLLAISPDGGSVYVANNGSNDVSVIDTDTNQVMGPPIPVGNGPFGIAITPDGTRVYVANQGSNDVSVIDATRDALIGTVGVGSAPIGVSVSPDGQRVYVTDRGSGDVSVINTATNQTVGAPIAMGDSPVLLALTPDGKRGYATLPASNGVAVVDTAANHVTGTPISVGTTPVGIAIVPDQPPIASFTDPPARVGAKVRLNASASTDPDGHIATYSWRFGDRRTAETTRPIVRHIYENPGRYQAKLTLTDDEGCSANPIFTGQTAYCNGSAVAMATRTVRVGYPRLTLRCPELARGMCTLSAVAVTSRRHGKVESIAARARVRPGQARILKLKFKKRFRARQGQASSVLTRQTVRVDHNPRVRFQRLRLKNP